MDKPVDKSRTDTSEHTKFSIIYNPVAGSRRRSLLDQVATRLDDRGCDVAIIGTTGPGNATKIAEEAVQNGSDVIVAAGGDGTINEVVSGVADSSVPVGILPMGTANVLAQELGIPRKPEALVDILNGGQCRPLHLPQANGRPFILMAGAGFDGQIVHAITSARKRRWGKYAFLFEGLRAIASNPHRALKIDADGQTISAGWAVVTNVSQYGGPYTLAPDADPGVPRLTLVAFRDAGPISMCFNMVRIGLGNACNARAVTTVTAKRIFIAGRVDTPIPVQIDGDAAGMLPLEISVSDRFVNILAPNQTSGRNG